MYRDKIYGEQSTFRFQFAKNFADQWALIFLIAIPLIEMLRMLHERYGSKSTKQPTCTCTCPSAKIVNSKLLQNMIFLNPRKILTSFCKRRYKHAINKNGNGNNDTVTEKLLHKNKHSDKEEIALEMMSTKSPNKKSIKKSKTNHKNKPKNKNKNTEISLVSLNTYDLFKLLSTLTMFVDHYSYFGLPGLSYKQSSWFRIIGRTAAPGFFFLAGWSSKKFRVRTWMAAFMIYAFTTVIPLAFVHSPWESILNILLANCIFYYIPPATLHNPFIHLVAFCLLQYYRKLWSQWNVGYGTLPIMFAVSGDLIRKKHRFGVFWLLASIGSFYHSSNAAFSSTQYQTYILIFEAVLNGIIMFKFKVVELSMFNKAAPLRFIRNAIQWLSREGLVVYIGHLVLFKLIQMCVYAGYFRHLYQ